MKSRYFQLVRNYFIARREALFQEECKTEFDIILNRGAIREVTRFLQHPELMAEYYAAQAPEKSPDTPTQTVPNWIQALQQHAGEDLI
jgi:hypothetical protein